MNSQFRKFGLVMSACVETVVFMFAAKLGGDWLNNSFPKSFNWFGVTSLLALIMIVHSWYVILRILVRDEKNSSISKQDDHNHGR